MDDAPLPEPGSLINRERSWLDFACRVVTLAEDPDLPLMERVKFAGIMGMIYDEFAMKRIGGLRQRLARGDAGLSPDGLTAEAQLTACRDELARHEARLGRLVVEILLPELATTGTPLLTFEELEAGQRDALRRRFRDTIEPTLTPLAVDISHPFPFISNLGLNLALEVTDRGQRQRFVRLKVPIKGQRWIPLPEADGCVALEDVILNCLDLMFPAAVSIEGYPFRVIRGAKDSPWDQGDPGPDASPGQLLAMVAWELEARRFAGVVRLQVGSSMPERMRTWLAAHLEVDMLDVGTIEGPLAVGDLTSFPGPQDAIHHDVPYTPALHPRFRDLSAKQPERVFAEIRRGDILVHHPYQSFDRSVLLFLDAASRDPTVLAIKLTIYRISARAPVIEKLLEAVRAGKQVAVLVEITARFDEEPNMRWAHLLEREGVHVIYGMEQLKTHAKLAMVVRHENSGIRRYCHLGTGNYHDGTARLYEDLGLFTANSELGEDVAALFNELTGATPYDRYRHLLVAPRYLRPRFTELIRREAEHARAGRPSGIRAKMNQLQDPALIGELYAASQAGVPIELNVRGLNCLRAGVPGLSDTIRVLSVVGRFLEHSRVYRFENGGQPEHFLGSADWMKRNLDRRVEQIVPVLDHGVAREIDAILASYGEDNASAWDMQSDGSYVRRRPAPGEPSRRVQEMLMERAAAGSPSTVPTAVRGVQSPTTVAS
ncbi:MAG: polyphosphate kinase 1 [Gammaproteobacteria bacterium]|jgi:polyphosphate kinase|nr:polyphosphate kinase 1 [Gammaproteobacteria bacterium]